MLDVIEVGRVRRQGQQGAVFGGQQCAQGGFSVKGSVVQDDDLPLGQKRQQVLFHPRLDQGRVARAGEGQGRDELTLAKRRHHRHARGLVAQAYAGAPLAFGTPAIGAHQSVVQAALIHIHPLGGRDVRNLFPELRPRGRVLFTQGFGVDPTLFLRVQLARLKVTESVCPDTLCPVCSCHSAAICFNVWPP